MRPNTCLLLTLLIRPKLNSQCRIFASLYPLASKAEPSLIHFIFVLEEARTKVAYATLPMTNAATPSSSARHFICTVTPVFAEKAMRTMAATLPPVIVLPYNLSVCVLVLRAMSVPSSGCRERVLVSCSVASVRYISCLVYHDSAKQSDLPAMLFILLNCNVSDASSPAPACSQTLSKLPA
jgi:hypothetical protein